MTVEWSDHTEAGLLILQHCNGSPFTTRRLAGQLDAGENAVYRRAIKLGVGTQNPFGAQADAGGDR